jgi:hypothetical protein
MSNRYVYFTTLIPDDGHGRQPRQTPSLETSVQRDPTSGPLFISRSDGAPPEAQLVLILLCTSAFTRPGNS